MSKLRRKKSGDDSDVDMVPVMNMFLVLIPFLLTSASFFQIKVINTSVPVSASSNSSETISKENDIKLTAILEIKKNGMDISVISEELTTKDIEKFKNHLQLMDNGEYPIAQMTFCLKNMKEKFPKSDTLVIIPEENIQYDTIIISMDAARQLNKQILFPNVVLSGKV